MILRLLVLVAGATKTSYAIAGRFHPVARNRYKKTDNDYFITFGVKKFGNPSILTPVITITESHGQSNPFLNKNIAQCVGEVSFNECNQKKKYELRLHPFSVGFLDQNFENCGFVTSKG